MTMKTAILRLDTQGNSQEIRTVRRICVQLHLFTSWGPRPDDTDHFVIRSLHGDDAEIDVDQLKARLDEELRHDRYGVFDGNRFLLTDRRTEPYPNSDPNAIVPPQSRRFEISDDSGFLNAFGSSIEAAKWAGAQS